MTQRQKNSWSWSAIGILIILAGAVWRSSAIASDVQNNTEDIVELEIGIDGVILIAMEVKNDIDGYEKRFVDIEERLDDLEHMEEMIEDIHAAIVGED